MNKVGKLVFQKGYECGKVFSPYGFGKQKDIDECMKYKDELKNLNNVDERIEIYYMGMRKRIKDDQNIFKKFFNNSNQK